MNLGISKAIKDDGDAVLYIALISAMAANFTPTIADGLYFNSLQRWKQELNEGKITPEQYWRKTVFNYYTYTAGFYGSLLLVMLAIGNKKDVSFKSKLLLGLIGGGVVVGVAMKNVQKDKEIEEMKKQENAKQDI